MHGRMALGPGAALTHGVVAPRARTQASRDAFAADVDALNTDVDAALTAVEEAVFEAARRMHCVPELCVGQAATSRAARVASEVREVAVSVIKDYAELGELGGPGGGRVRDCAARLQALCDEVARDRKAKPGTPEASADGVVGLPEGLKQLVGKLGRDTDSRITNF